MAGRNEPCPCGSNKKYKKCCSRRADRNNFLLQRWDSLVFAIHEELRAQYPQEVLVEWVADFGYDPLEAEEMPFMLGFLAFYHPLGNGQTPVQLYFGDGSRLQDVDDEFHLKCMALPCSIYKVTEQSGPSQYVLCDLLRKRTPHVVRLGRPEEDDLSVGTSIFGKLLWDGDTWVPLSLHPRALMGEAGDWAVKEFLGERKSCHSSTLSKPESAKRLYQCWAGVVEKSLENDEISYGLPEMVNFDGEQLVLSRDVWSFDPKRRAWLIQGLLRVEGLKEAEEDTFVYGTEERPILGIVTLKESELWVDSNSSERVDQISTAVCKQCGDLLTFVREVEQEEIVASASEYGTSKEESTESLTLRELLENPALRAQLEAQLPEGVSLHDLIHDYDL